MTGHTLFAEQALLPDGWAQDVLLEVDGRGDLVRIMRGAEAGEATRLAGPVLPGMPNLHSHAFQRAMAGLAEHVDEGASRDDSFWTWREGCTASSPA